MPQGPLVLLGLQDRMVLPGLPVPLGLPVRMVLPGPPVLLGLPVRMVLPGPPVLLGLQDRMVLPGLLDRPGPLGLQGRFQMIFLHPFPAMRFDRKTHL